jgi:predicted metalloprotease
MQPRINSLAGLAMRFAAAIACAAVLICVGAVPSHADKRVALVVGNDRYANLAADQQLRKAVNDARAVGDKLATLGFEVIRGENLGRLALIDKLDEFTRRLSPGDTAFFFFSGHGVAIGGGNYILPSDMPQVESGQDVKLARAALGESDIIGDLQSREVRVAVVVLDACRDNPFKRAGTKGVGGERGLTRIEPVRGVFSLYSAGIGQTALDRLGNADADPNSVFTRALLPALGKPGLHLSDLAIEVREQVARLARTVGHDQVPAYYDQTIGGRVYLAGLPQEPKPVEPPRPPAVSEAERAWLAGVKDTTSEAVLDDFIRRYGDSIYGTLARERREGLKKSQVTAIIAPPAQLPPPSKPQDHMAAFVERVIGSTEAQWKKTFAQAGRPYGRPVLVLYSDATDAQCGGDGAQSFMGPFYCPADQKLYLDTSFFEKIATRFRDCDIGGKSCQFSQAYVIAHEVGHHVQNVLGILPKAQQAQRAASSKAEMNNIQLRVELQADCLAGIWARYENEHLKSQGKPPMVETGEAEAALRTVTTIGDDTLQRKAQGNVVPDSFTHGSAEQRQRWFDTGFRSGSMPSCNTFAAPQL